MGTSFGEGVAVKHDIVDTVKIDNENFEGGFDVSATANAFDVGATAHLATAPWVTDSFPTAGHRLQVWSGGLRTTPPVGTQRRRGLEFISRPGSLGDSGAEAGVCGRTCQRRHGHPRRWGRTLCSNKCCGGAHSIQINLRWRSDGEYPTVQEMG